MPGRTCRSAVFKPGHPIPIHIDVQAPNRKFAYNLSKCEVHWRDEDHVVCRGVSVSHVGVGREGAVEGRRWPLVLKRYSQRPMKLMSVARTELSRRFRILVAPSWDDLRITGNRPGG